MNGRKDSILTLLIKPYRFRFFLFILLIYLAGATLDITNTNPGSRFMLTKEIAQEGSFAIREEVRANYSYLDFSVLNQINNSGFEYGEGEDANEWIEGGNARRVNNSSHSGNYSLELQSQGDWVERKGKNLDVDKIYENFTFKIWAKRIGTSTAYLNVTITFTDHSERTFWLRVYSSS